MTTALQEPSEDKYLHGYSEEEQNRLYKQARFMENKIYADIDLSMVTNLLEVGCGVGAQSEILLRRYPQLFLTGIDYSDKQISKARKFLSTVLCATDRYELQQGNAMDMDFPSQSKFDGAFLCWVLEHIPEPSRVLSEVRRVLRPGSPIVVTEVLNSSFFVEPYSPNVLQYWMRFNDLQYDMKGDPFVGAKLGNLLQSVGYQRIETKPKTYHLDNRNPAKRAEMIGFWTELLLSGLPQLLEAGYVGEDLAEKVKEEMHIVAKNPNAVFFYTFMQATAYTS
ncbi:methyltransferase family protein [Pontibacter ummariensis]|uniref:Methyltransferase domain-containing protein n=1 Tax=Pontibacter ummariensis TaxID=1610492 RepID=A0A239B719_9BACT|nr:class I SAM-dependent methyltransferase [Pontibacter ummariensis]PRY16313.1 methyltransferase family protein [Pontibacter ummariensis]SNS02993.1 Methyltransferase domain-containing protein [Pontibacter ummariensis]